MLFFDIGATRSVDGRKNKKITEAITNFIVYDNKPFSTVDGYGFQALIKELAPLYKMPSRETIKNRIDDQYEAISTSFKKSVHTKDHYSLTYDIWTETMQNKSFLGVTLHFIEQLQLVSATLGVFELSEGHTASYIKSELRKVCLDWNIETFDIWNIHNELAQKNMRKKALPRDISLSTEMEVQMYISASITSGGLHQNPFTAWEGNKALFPELYKLAHKLFTAAATSVPSERVFSKAGATITQTRNRLQGKRLSTLLFLNSIQHRKL